MASGGSDAEAQARSSNVDRMCSLEGFDVIIVCTGSEHQASYWQARLEAGQGSIIPHGSKVLAVTEDWPGGAGNALGTLFAWQNAAALARARYPGFDLDAELNSGRISAGLFHTAGKGTRLAPLPGSESNNKPGVKLPAAVRRGGGSGGSGGADGESAVALTILEAVIKQTSIYARSRRGRLSVFWGDQVFIASVSADYTPTCHADILCTLGPMPDAETWRARGLDKYGLIAVTASGAAQVEKVDHATAVRLLASLGAVSQVGASLGSFSVSAALLAALLSEFAGELRARAGKLDTDPHLWMPLTLPCAAYVELMAQKGVAEGDAAAHHARMAGVRERLMQADGGGACGLFGAVDVGAAAYWWDYGQLPLYVKNCLLLCAQGPEAALLRRFAAAEQCSGGGSGGGGGGGASVDAASVVSACALGAGSVRGSALAFVRCARVEAEGCILVNVTARKVTAGPGAVVYNVVDDSEEGLSVAAGGVLVGVGDAQGGQTLVRSSKDVDGGKAWKEAVLGNSRSFEQIYEANMTADVAAVERLRTAAAHVLWRSIQG
ncbi:hypothetical protein JKP88DRAFT_196778 [Tribonema minus]|uniref:Uncharacterized protein n=1 Tax=Tribonema minus TaxID=303371 RepID=A0A835YJK1_9STRA|nr:hypothetical protein JKP88DRAFT_196778 [Tribonema minus]